MPIHCGNADSLRQRRFTPQRRFTRQPGPELTLISANLMVLATVEVGPEEKSMRSSARVAILVVISLAMIAPMASLANAQATSNPVVSSAKELFTRQSGYIVKAAEEMPADKYSYHPTADQWSFGRIIAHIIQGNNAVCAMLSDAPQPQGPKVSETDSKDPKEHKDILIGALQVSFQFCDKALANLQDAKLGDTVTFFRGTQVPRARALFELIGDLEDHYAQLAAYLRLCGLTPPSANSRAT
jgi:uncharacterized damage-inducible protein DinB